MLPGIVSCFRKHKRAFVHKKYVRVEYLYFSFDRLIEFNDLPWAYKTLIYLSEFILALQADVIKFIQHFYQAALPAHGHEQPACIASSP